MAAESLGCSMTFQRRLTVSTRNEIAGGVEFGEPVVNRSLEETGRREGLGLVT